MPKNVYRLLLLLTTVALLTSVPTIAKANAYEATAQDDLFRNAPDDQYVIVSSGGGYFTSRDENRVKQDNPIGFPGQKGVGESTVGELRKLFKEHGALMSRLWTGFFGTESCRTPKIFQNPDFTLKRRDFWVFFVGG
ncbi:hypothetical protein, partial [Weissella confusa]|uniref:hypothetical protein n=1 Tax=Weissella confusa TaxID=1583 RepID=UPI0018F11045